MTQDLTRTIISLHNVMAITEIDIALEKAEDIFCGYLNKRQIIVPALPRRDLKDKILDFFEHKQFLNGNFARRTHDHIGIKVEAHPISPIKYVYKAFLCAFYFDIHKMDLMHQQAWELVHEWK